MGSQAEPPGPSNFINKLIKREKIAANDRQALRTYLSDILSCIATLTQMKYFADLNTNKTLRVIVKRLPNSMIDKWKGRAAKICDKGKTHSINHISDFIHQRVKVEFDPDFRDFQHLYFSCLTKGHATR